jgi:phosphoserine aminotransferase
MKSNQINIRNFNAGPSILPKTVFEQSAEAVLNFNNSGLSILEISHRSKDFEAVVSETEALVREIGGFSEEFEVLFLTGGASTQFFMVPMNLLGDSEKAVYLDTGSWSSKAIKEAKNFGEVVVAASSKASNYSFIPKNYDIPVDAVYLHYTSNNTIFGTQFHILPSTSLPLVSDMSSDIFSRPIEPSRYGLIYAGAQKNLGPAGVTLVLVRKSLLGRTSRRIPTMLDFVTHAQGKSLYNTPPVFSIYVMMLTLRWIKELGGLRAVHERNLAKANLLYGEIDSNPCFKGTAAQEDRSFMNVCFVPEKPEFEVPFMELCKSEGIVGIKGHRSVGGFRASIYNAMDLEGVQVLVDVMKDFASRM